MKQAQALGLPHHVIFINLIWSTVIEDVLHGLYDPGQEHASSPTQPAKKPSTSRPKPFLTALGDPQSASSQIWQRVTCTEPRTALSRSTMY